MENSKTFVVICKQGRYKDECPYIKQEGICCVECPYAGYIIREPIKKEENVES